jgi:hypothetical protein
LTTHANSFLGDVTRAFVVEGNYQMALTALLFMLAHVIQNMAILEQPLGSSMPRAPPLCNVLEFIKARKVVTWHSAFGAISAKPLQLWSNNLAAMRLRRARPHSTNLKTLARKHEDVKYSGKPIRMKKSQAYTPEFGKAVAEMAVSELRRVVP